MRALTIVSIVWAFMQLGCQSIMLERYTLSQARTLSDLQYAEVLSNLAMFAENPSALPYYSLTGTGINRLDHTAQASFTPSIDLLLNPAKTLYEYYGDKLGFSLQGTHLNSEQWTSAAVLNPDELKLMRCAYRRALGVLDPNCGKLDQFFDGKPESLAVMAPGWFCIGPHSAVPPHACYVGHYHKTYAWVPAHNLECLTQFTLAILDIGTALPLDKPGPVGAVALAADAKQKKIQALIAQATPIADLLSKDPDRTKPGALLLEMELDATLVAIYMAETGKTAEQVKTEIANSLKAPGGTLPKWKALVTGPAESSSAQTDAVVNSLIQAADEKSRSLSAISAPAAPILQPRKNLFNPYLYSPGP